MSAHDEIKSLQNECLSIYGEKGPQDAKEFKQCRDLVNQWMQKARSAMVMHTQMRGVHLGPQTYAQTTGKPIRDGTNALTDMDDVAIEEAADSLEHARSFLGNMRLHCWERLKLDLDAL